MSAPSRRLIDLDWLAVSGGDERRSRLDRRHRCYTLGHYTESIVEKLVIS